MKGKIKGILKIKRDTCILSHVISADGFEISIFIEGLFLCLTIFLKFLKKL